MASPVSIQPKSGNERKAFTYTSIVFIAILLLLFIWKFEYKQEAEGGGGIEIDFGNSLTGLGDDNTSLGTPSRTAEPSVPVPEPAPQAQDPVVETRPATPAATNTKSNANNDVLTSNNAESIALEKKKRQEEKDRKAVEEKAQAEARAKAEADARAKALADAKRREEEEFRNKMQGGLSGINGSGSGGTGSGSGQGNTSPGGNQGDPGGSMNGGNGTGGSGGGTGGGHGTGSGSGVGSGSSIGSHTLTGRSMVSKPTVVNNKAAYGRVVIKVTVDKKGNVIAANYNSQGSTTNDAYLIELSVNSAKKIKFNASSTATDEQFGTVTFNYTAQ